MVNHMWTNAIHKLPQRYVLSGLSHTYGRILECTLLSCLNFQGYCNIQLSLRLAGGDLSIAFGQRTREYQFWFITLLNVGSICFN